MYIVNIFLFFIIYSILGWVAEIFFILITKKKLTNRGFLIGPYCPIYGVGCVLIIYILKPLINYPILLFLCSILICSILEYTTSYILEKIFHARWWDYSKDNLNINGRISLRTMIPFGIMACVIMYILDPIITNILANFKDKTKIILAITSFIIIMLDIIISITIITHFRKTIKNQTRKECDNTAEITEYTKQTLMKKSNLYRYLVTSCPNLKSKIKNKLEEAAEKI